MGQDGRCSDPLSLHLPSVLTCLFFRVAASTTLFLASVSCRCLSSAPSTLPRLARHSVSLKHSGPPVCVSSEHHRPPMFSLGTVCPAACVFPTPLAPPVSPPG